MDPQPSTLNPQPSTHTLKRTGEAPLRFTGELLAEADGERFAGRERNRWYELRLYRADSGDYIVAVSYHTRWEGEADRHEAWLTDTPRDVLVHWDCVPEGVGYPRVPQHAARQAKLEADLRSQYESLVSDLLAEMPETLEDLADARREERDLARYRGLLAEGLAECDFTAAEACLIADANNGIGSFDLYDPERQTEWRFWPANVEDGIRLNRLDAKWDVDPARLIHKLGLLSPTAKCAVADALERFWSDEKYRDAEAAEALAELGLVQGGRRSAEGGRKEGQSS